MNREPNHELLLEYVYGLLDSNDPVEQGLKEQIEKHLATSSEWQAALAAVKAQQQQFSRAARIAANDVVFAPPAAESPAVVEPAAAAPTASAARVKTTSARATGWRWVAVAVCVTLLGLGGWFQVAASRHDQRVAVAEERVAAARAKQAEFAEQERQAAAALEQARQELARLDAGIERRSQLVYKEAAQREFFVQVTRPAHVEPGSPFALVLEARDFAERPVQPKLSLRVVDENKKVVVPPDQVAWLNPRPGEYVASLPPTLQVKSDATWSVEVQAEMPGAPPQVYTDRLQLFRSRYITHVTTDKPMYQPGESVYFRSLTLDRATLRPVQEDLTLDVTIKNGRGEQVFQEVASAQLRQAASQELVKGPNQRPLQGMGAGVFVLPADAPGGEYTLTVSERSQRFPPEQRKFLVQRYEKPRLRKELEFTRKSYGPGDEVVAFCRVTAAEGGKPIANQPVQVTFLLDGAMLDAEGKDTRQPWTLQTDAAGHVLVRCRLPKAIDRGDASLSVRFTDGGVQETLVRPVPVVVNKCFIQLYPEGGDLIAGVPNRVYFTARTPLDRPAELKARLVDQDRQVVAELETFHDDHQPGANQGMGVFTFTPKVESRYFLLVDRPERIEPVVQIPDVKPAGVVLSVPVGGPRGGEPWRFSVTSQGRDRRLLIGLYCRGLLVGQQRVAIKAGQRQELALLPATAMGGVHRVTVFEEEDAGPDPVRLRPVAERLVYRAPTEHVKLRLSAQRQDYLPGDRAQVAVAAETETGKPAPAVLLLSVVDKNLLTLADEKTARAMPTHFFLTHELRKPDDLEHADFLLSDHAKALVALDLMLGTQGWRRFAEQDPRQFREQYGDDAERLMRVQGQTPVVQSNRAAQFEVLRKRLEATDDRELTDLQVRRKAAAEQVSRAEETLSALDRGVQAHLDALLEEAVARVADLHAQWQGFRHQFAKTAGASLLLAVLLGGLVPASRRLAGWFGTRGSMGVMVGAVSLVVTATVIVATGLYATLGQSKVAQVSGIGAPLAAEVQNEAHPAGPALGAVPKVPMDLKADQTPAPPAPVLPPMVIAPDPGAGGQLAGKDALREGESASRGPDFPPPRYRASPTPPNISAVKQTPDSGVLPPETADAKKEMSIPGAPVAEMPRPPAPTKSEARVLVAPLPSAAGAAIPPGPPGRDSLPMPSAPVRPRTTRRAPDDSKPGQGAAPVATFMVREYAHQRSSGSSTARTDFTETLYWHPVLVIADGQGRVSFDLSDSVTTFQVTAYAHTLDGRLGAATLDFAAKLPFNLEPKLPAEITANDVVDLPVSLANNVDGARSVKLGVRVEGLTLEGPVERDVELKPHERRRSVLRVRPSLVDGPASIHLVGRSEPFFVDSVNRSLTIVPDGFPIVTSFSGTLDRYMDLDLLLPDQWVPGTLKLQAAVYPTVLADLLSGLDGLLREPHGCFEQTSSSNYPNLLILNYLQETNQAQPAVARRARELLAQGYAKLISFECLNRQEQRRGYEWFGGRAAPHEALTAYGLMQFRDMKAVMPVDDVMLARTERFLLERRDGKGGFRRNPKSLDSFGRAPDPITNAYILWSLTEASVDADLSAEVNAVLGAAETSQDPYFLALAANIALNVRRADTATAILRRLVSLQQRDGRLDGATTSITGSGGRDLHIETTALTLLAWLKAKDPAFNDPGVKAMRWLTAQRGGYGAFGSTQATVLALKALIAYGREHRRAAEGGDLVLEVAGQEIGRTRFTVEQNEPVELHLNADRLLKPGRNTVRLTLTGKNVFPYSLRCTYRTLQPASAEGCALRIAANLDRTQVKEGDTVRLTVKLTNVSGKGQGMAVAILGLPAGLSLPEDAKQLRDYTRLLDDDTRPGRIAAWEINGRELVLYWRDLAPHAEIELPIDLVARVPGQYRGPASRAYLYYNADAKHWLPPLSVTILPER